MNFDERIREKLNPLINLPTEFQEFGSDTCFVCGFPFSKKERERAVDKTLSAIKTIIKESLPEKKDRSKYDKRFPFKDQVNSGFNECRDEIHKRLGI